MDKISGSAQGGYPAVQNQPEVKAQEEVATPVPQDTVSISKGKKKKSGPISKIFSTITSGVGLSSGVIGGGLLGAAVGTSGSLLTGLLAKSVTMAALTSAGMTGGIVGAIAFGVAGAYGGWKMSEMVVNSAKWVKNKITGK
ncbi:MAG: hypothetical protein K8T10_19585 [Candidatus Eremiobacteraeota bacterium]|nr:hypothetical protein [Candidatus Eremiobacteraeota bacterium]